MNQRLRNDPSPTATIRSWGPRLAAVALLAVVIVAFYALVLKPFADDYIRLQESIEDQNAMHIRFAKIAAEREALQNHLDELRDRASLEPLLVKGESETLAAAALQDRVSDIIGATGGHVQSIQALPPSDKSGFASVGVRVQFIGGYEAIYQTLHTIETGEPYLFVKSLDIRKQRRRRKRNEDQSQDRTLLAALEVVGYLAPEDR